MLDQRGAKSTSCGAVEVLRETGVYRVLSLTYVMFIAEGACDYINYFSGEDGYGAQFEWS